MRRDARAIIVTLTSLFSLGLYLAWARTDGYTGFPLDDAWIHQTYARNLVESGQWAFVPGQPSAGSTAPLWTLLLALGYLMRIPFRAWTYGLGWLCLVGAALLASELAQRLFPRHRWAAHLAGLACTVEWHLVWAAGSGMETLLFALLALAIWYRVSTGPAEHPFLTGVLGGTLILTRPEGILVVGLAGLALLLATGRQWRTGLTRGAALVLGLGLVVAPYLILNLRLSGTLWPNTMYAKQTEYAVLRLQPLATRLWRVGTAPLIGPQALLMPGLLWIVWRQARGRARSEAWGSAAWMPLMWVAGTVVTYSLRLPVTYQHGRYLIPTIPVLVIYGLGGTLDLVSVARRLPARVLARALLIGSLLAFPLFSILIGAPAYATDVAIIEEEMVAVAHWIADHTPPQALIAAHDIGALGYFSPRPLLDLAGLVSPEVIPFIRNEVALLAWMRTQGADYLVTFPSWYPQLTAAPGARKVFQTDAAVTLAHGRDNMAVYRLEW
jgi:hypothetical protein